jgi:chemosensory pili system protein ChpB (putative protein-glutamate methylesterase)
MVETPQAALRVALLAQDCRRGEFRALLENEGIEVVLDGSFDFPLPQSWNGAEVLLVDMDGTSKRHEVESVLQQVPVPVLLNAGGIGDSSIWHRRLVGKLQTLANRAIPSARITSDRQRPDLHLVQEGDAADEGAMWLVVLGASIGGPKAVARFLQALPPDLPVVLLLAQHISESFQDLLAEQLDRCSQWPVALLGENQVVDNGQVWLVPSERRIEMDGSGEIRWAADGWLSAQKPDIDDVLHTVASAFGSRCGAIMFSGLGKDGTRGCESVSEQGGFIWAQSAESCVIPNMPEATRRCCRVEYSGTPEELAQALVGQCRLEQASIN